MIIRLDLAPGDVVREADLQTTLGIGRTPIREALQRLARDHFVTVIPRRGMFVSAIDVGELSMLYETRALMEPYAARLACMRGTAADWDEMSEVLARHPAAGRRAGRTPRPRSQMSRDHLARRRQPVPHRHPRHAVCPERPSLAHVPRGRCRHGPCGRRTRRDPRSVDGPRRRHGRRAHRGPRQIVRCPGPERRHAPPRRAARRVLTARHDPFVSSL